MKKIFYTIISRDEFVKLHKFGSIFINSDYKIEETNDSELEEALLELLKELPFDFEDEKGYIILKIEDNIKYSPNSKLRYKLEIQKIKSIYGLSKETEYFYTTKVIPKVKFQDLPFSHSLLDKIIRFKIKEDMQKGIDILFEQFCSINKQKVNKEINKDEFIDKYIKDGDTYYLELEFDFYRDLLSYKRENNFKKEDISYVYDCITIFFLKDRNDKKIKAFKSKNLNLNIINPYKELDDNKKETLYETIKFIKEQYDNNTEEKLLQKLVEKVEFSELLSGVLFLKIKDLLNEKKYDDIKKLINEFKKEYNKELSTSLYLIGIQFGYKNLYEYYYDNYNNGLDIYQKSEEGNNNKETESITKIFLEPEVFTTEGLANLYYASSCNKKTKKTKNYKLAELKRKNKDELIKLIEKCNKKEKYLLSN